MTDYKVALEVYNGPLDLLLFLIRRDEIDIYDIPITRITQSYLAYVEVIQKLDPDLVSEFLILAATLMEIKSRVLLPRPPIEEGEEELIDPRSELVRQLLEYKKFKDAAYALEDRADERAQRFTRAPNVPPVDPQDIELEDLEIWDLFEAFQKLLVQTGKAGGFHTIPRDDTPIALHADDILDSLQRAGGSQEFVSIFAGRARAEMIGLFLALLELIRQKRVRAAQERPFSPILLQLLDATPLQDIAAVERAFQSEAPPANDEAVDDSAAVMLLGEASADIEDVGIAVSEDESWKPDDKSSRQGADHDEPVIDNRQSSIDN